MNKLEQAARQALEALEELHYSSGTVVAVRMYESATAALREALEQHKPHEECECSACLNYFTDKAHEEALEQPVSQEPKSDCPCCGAKSSVLPMAFCRECKSEFWPPQPVRTKDLTDDEIADALYGKGCWRLGVHPDHLREYRRVIQADRELNK